MYCCKRKNYNLIDAVKYSSIERIKKTIRLDVNPDLRDDKGNTALFYACKRGDIEILGLLLEANSSINLQNNKGETVLFYSGWVDIIKLLLEMGADPNIQDELCNTALVFYINRLNIVNLLLEYGANPFIENTDKQTAHLVLYNRFRRFEDYKKIMDSLLKFDTPSIALACKNENYELVKLLIQEGENPNRFDNEGNSALYYCQTNWMVFNSQQTDIVKLLLDANINPNITSTINPEPTLFTFADNENIIEMLLKVGVNPDDEFKGKTLLSSIIEHAYINRKPISDRDTKIAKLLVSYGANMDLIYDDMPLLVLLFESKELQLFQFLVEAGANINVKTYSYLPEWILTTIIRNEDYDKTQTEDFIKPVPLYENHVITNLVKLLINAGVDTNCLRSSLYYAKQNGNTEVVKILKDVGANDDLIQLVDNKSVLGLRGYDDETCSIN